MRSEVYFWNTALSFAMVMILISLSSVSILFAAARRERSFWIFSAGYVFGTASFFLFPAQGGGSPWIGIIAANGLLLLYHFCITWGIRLFYSYRRPWPLRFWIYLISFITIFMFFTFPYPVYQYRGAVFSLYVIVLTAEFFIVLAAGTKGLPKPVRVTVLIFIFSAIVFHGIRIALLLTLPKTEHLFMEANSVTAYSFSFMIFIAIAWAGSLIMLDDIRLMNDMRQKNILLENLAMKDELTGVFNRRFLEQTFHAEMERQDRYGEPMSLIMIDIDYFKSVNDRFGHDAGDKILTEATSRIRNNIRETDILFRWGGEEFFILMPHTNLAGAAQLAEKLRNAVAETEIPPAGTVTASFGVAEREKGESRSAVFRRLDQTLYCAKRNGRNRVEIQAECASPAVLIRIEWNAEWESGNQTIDSQHKELVRMGNTLINLSISNAEKKETLAALDRLLHHVIHHFQEEERIIRNAEYPGAEEHSAIHTRLISEAERFREEFLDGRIDSSDMYDFIIKKLIVNHLIEEDTNFYPYLREYHG
jgi:diguanylate cyclase (GGDEF)-like protein/hemerythrin-like metal-binding protein